MCTTKSLHKENSSIEREYKIFVAGEIRTHSSTQHLDSQSDALPMTALKRCSSSEVDGEIPHKTARISSEATTSFELFPLLGEEKVREEVPLERFLAIVVSDKKLIGEILKKLAPLDDKYAHLKRIKDGRILIGPKNGETTSDVHLLSITGVDSIVEVEVPARKPLTRRQFDWAKQRWPTAFHGDPGLEAILRGSFITDNREYLRKFSTRAIETGCVVVQDGGEVVSGTRGHYLLDHPVMCCVRSLAEYRASTQSKHYLATGSDVFLRSEPCAMCAMGLVHARAARVFFCRRSSNGVFCNGGWQLHLEPRLNHHYDAFYLKLEEKEETELNACGSV